MEKKKEKKIEVLMDITLWEGEYEKENKTETWYSTSLEFFATIVDEQTSMIQFLAQRLKPPSDRRRRDIMYHLLCDIPFYLVHKSRNRVRFNTYMTLDRWLALQTICQEKFTLTQEMYEEWLKMSTESLERELKAIYLASEIRGDEDATAK